VNAISRPAYSSGQKTRLKKANDWSIMIIIADSLAYILQGFYAISACGRPVIGKQIEHEEVGQSSKTAISPSCLTPDAQTNSLLQ
jgi:hypothetical protein